MAKNYFVAEKAELKCTLGTAPGKLMVTGDRKSFVREGGKDKALANEGEKTLEPPFFGNCKCSSSNPPCSPALQQWQHTAKKSTIAGKKALLDCSRIQCTKGGMITISDPNQKKRVTGEVFPELDKRLPEFQGEIIFVNGYHSDSFGGSWNAFMDIDPDKDHWLKMRGHNANTENKIDPDDILTREELVEIEEKLAGRQVLDEVSGNQRIHELPMQAAVPVKNELEGTRGLFWGYWNDERNQKKGSQTYAKYFNAEKNEHFINGSKGLGSNGAYRLDHGIAQGYDWAYRNWEIRSREEVESNKEHNPYIETYSPAYKPVTIVMHSQGNAPGAGATLGILKYAKEKGWDEIPVNLIYLGVHQPLNCYGEEYDALIDIKTKYYGVNNNFFIDGLGLLRGVLLKEDRQAFKFMNSLSDLFNPKYHKLKNKRGIYEHLKAVTNGGWDALLKCSVQFTFANDRGDLVLVDRDLPDVDSACDPDTNASMFSVEYFDKEIQIPSHLTSGKKEIIPLRNGGSLGVPEYAVIKRIDVEEDEDEPDGIKKNFWEDYRSVATDWGNAFGKLVDILRSYEGTGRYNLPKKAWFAARGFLAYREMLYQYGRLQMADLYAHFAPVGNVLDIDLLKSSDNFKDTLGTESVWERVKKAGEDKFYRIDAYEGGEKLSEEEMRNEAKNFVEGKGQDRLISTSIADTDYVKDVLTAYVSYLTEDEQERKAAERRLYKEPDKHIREAGALSKEEIEQINKEAQARYRPLVK